MKPIVSSLALAAMLGMAHAAVAQQAASGDAAGSIIAVRSPGRISARIRCSRRRTLSDAMLLGQLHQRYAGARLRS